MAEAEQPTSGEEAPTNKELIGEVFQFFGGPGVAAIKLTGDLTVGDEIWVERGDNLSFRDKVESMQIDRNDVESAGSGQDVGIKLKNKASNGNKIYRITG